MIQCYVYYKICSIILQKVLSYLIGVNIGFSNSIVRGRKEREGERERLREREGERGILVVLLKSMFVEI
jgi:hypothetical protein